MLLQEHPPASFSGQFTLLTMTKRDGVKVLNPSGLSPWTTELHALMGQRKATQMAVSTDLAVGQRNVA